MLTGNRLRAQFGMRPIAPGRESKLIIDRVAFGRAVEFQHLRNGEAGLKGGEYVGPQPIADAGANFMGAIVGAGRRIQQIATEFADVDEGGALLLRRVAPEGSGGKLVANEGRAAESQRHAERDQAAVRVVHRQTQIDAIAVARPDRRAEPVHDAQGARMRDAGRLGQTCRA